MHLFHYQEGKSIHGIHGLLQVLLFPVERKGFYMRKLKKAKILKIWKNIKTYCKILTK
jgi:hypothetical protein